MITQALESLAALGAVSPVRHATKGVGPAVELYTVADTRLRTTALARAVRRKAMPYARFLRLARTAGGAGELVVPHSLQDASTQLTAMTLGYGEVQTYGDLLTFLAPSTPARGFEWVTMTTPAGGG